MTDDTHTTTERTEPAERTNSSEQADSTGHADSAEQIDPPAQTARRATGEWTAVTDGGTDPETTTTAGTDPTAPATDSESTAARLRRLVDYLALGGLALLALVASIQVYVAIDTTIDRFVVREYRSLFRGVVNLALLLLAVGGVTLQLRRLR